MPSGKKDKSLKNKYSSFFNSDIPEPEPEPESSGERIYPTLRNMDANTLQRLSHDRDRSHQRTKELEGSLGLALQAIKRLEVDISVQTWRIPCEKRNINVLQGGVEENIGVYAKDKCSIPAGMGKYVPVQTNQDI